MRTRSLLLGVVVVGLAGCSSSPVTVDTIEREGSPVASLGPVLDAGVAAVTTTMPDEAAAPANEVVEVTLSSDGSLLATRFAWGDLAVWDRRAGKPLWSRALGCTSFAFTPDGADMAATAKDAVLTLSSRDGKEQARVPVPKPRALSPDLQLVAEEPRAKDATVVLVDARTGAVARTCAGPAAGLGGFATSELVFSADGKLLAGCAGASRDKNWAEIVGFIALYDVAGGRFLFPLSGDTGAFWDCVAFTPDGRTLVAAAGNSVYLVNLPDGSPRARITGHTAAVTATAVSPDGRWLASGDVNGRILLTELASLRLHEGPSVGVRITALRFVPGELLVATSEGKVLSGKVN